LLPFPEEVCPEQSVPPPVLAVPDPEPWAAVEPELVGLVCVSEPVLVVAEPVDGVEPVEESPAVALDELPVEAEADVPPDPAELADVEESVVVVALAEPPDAVEVGEGVGVGVGDGVGVGEGVGVGVGLVVPVLGVDCEPPVFWFECDPVPVCVAVGVGVGAAVEVGRGVVVLVEVVVVVEVVEVFDEPPLMDGFTLMIGCTMIVGELLTAATAVDRALLERR
jgi:hypothetical protein